RAVDPVPRPTTIPFSTYSTAFSAAALFNRSRSLTHPLHDADGRRAGRPGGPVTRRSDREVAHHVLDALRQRQRLVHRALPHVAAEDQPGRALLHGNAGLLEQILVADLAPAAEEDHRVPRRLDHAPHALLVRPLQLVVRLRLLGVLLALLRDVQLHDVGAQLVGETRRVVHGRERVAAALRLDRRATGIRPHDDRHPVLLALLANLHELQQVVVLAGRAHVERVADRVRAHRYRV